MPSTSFIMSQHAFIATSETYLSKPLHVDGAVFQTQAGK